MNVVLGSRGRLGRAIVASLDDGNCLTPDRGVYASWSDVDGASAAFRYFSEHSKKGGIVYVAAGLINPAAPLETHLRVNFELPKNIIEGASQAGQRIITFGTVMEQLVGETALNPYILSKTKFGAFAAECAARGNDILHIRIHTLFGGGAPDDFMFLGQIANALKARSPFKMSSGAQLREYHHIDDDVAAINQLIRNGTRGIVDLSHGEPIALRDLASHIFSSFGCHDLLHIGALPSPTRDNYESAFERTAALEEFPFRKTLPAVLDYLKACVNSREKNEG